MSIDRFGYRQKKRLAKFAARSPRLAQLASSFPLLFFALATGYGTARKRALALRMVEDGCKLRDIAAVMELPMVLRAVPPALLREKLVTARFSDKNAAKLVSFARTAGPSQRNAIAAAFYGSRLYNDSFGVWLAHIAVCDRVIQLEAVRAIALYAWASHQTHDPEVCFGVPPWCPELSLETACSNARLWIDRQQWGGFYAGKPLEDRWMRPGCYDGFDIVPLLTMAELKAETAVMRNCLGSYAPRLIGGCTRLYGVRKDGTPIATAEIVLGRRNRLRLAQVKGPQNADVPREVLRAVHRWWSEHAPWTGVPHEAADSFDPADERFEHIVRRYLKDGGRRLDLWSSRMSVIAFERELLAVIDDKAWRYGGRKAAGWALPAIGRTAGTRGNWRRDLKAATRVAQQVTHGTAPQPLQP